jgi:hypothetical protein
MDNFNKGYCIEVDSNRDYFLVCSTLMLPSFKDKDFNDTKKLKVVI